jgi:hypothetical protein
MSISRHDVMRLATETGADPRTIQKCLRGEPVSSVVRYAVAAAVEKLELDVQVPNRDDIQGAA